MTYTLPLDEIDKDDVQRCGGKGANLGELTQIGARVPPGFCITADALGYLLSSNSLDGPIAEVASRLDFEDLNALEAATAGIRGMIASARVPTDLEAEILERYRALVSDANRYVAVRSSVAVKDSPISSFPGMMDTYHYVLGETELLEKVRECWASLWTARAAFARHRQGIAQDRGLIAPVIQLMVNADTAGVLFTANPITGATTEIVIESNWGLGESVVSGRSMNDFYVLDKANLGLRERRVARKNVMVTMDLGRGSGRLEQAVPPERSSEPTLSDAQLVELGRTSKGIEDHFGFNVDMEWAYQDGILYVLQARRIRHVGKN
ncbi:MAG: phosphoenolpyruvate synthase, pyruvate, water dikinase [Chloroflexi bacterium CSP1-4]|nr:MAG: phosphoenolpyruvate synthase, pyruvate, water dikinase [Chloroflexi bacterium CSP1-4]